jgi:hypothetical protein
MLQELHSPTGTCNTVVTAWAADCVLQAGGAYVLVYASAELVRDTAFGSGVEAAFEALDGAFLEGQEQLLNAVKTVCKGDADRAHSILQATLKHIMRAGFECSDALAEAVAALAADVGRVPIGGASRDTQAAARTRTICVVGGDSSPGTLGLWWSDYKSACDVAMLRRHGVTCRLNVAEELVAAAFVDVDSMPIVHVPMYDTIDHEEPAESTLHGTWVSQLANAVSLLRSYREKGACVNVSCQMGKNRSAAVLVAYLVGECGWEFAAAVSFLRSKNAMVCANPFLLRAVAAFLNDTATQIPLNAAADGVGAWICFSPPGSPRS